MAESTRLLTEGDRDGHESYSSENSILFNNASNPETFLVPFNNVDYEKLKYNPPKPLNSAFISHVICQFGRNEMQSKSYRLASQSILQDVETFVKRTMAKVVAVDARLAGSLKNTGSFHEGLKQINIWWDFILWDLPQSHELFVGFTTK